MINSHEMQETQKAFREGAIRLCWVGSLANGAVLLGAMQMIGGLDDPDFAIESLRWSLLLIAVGLGFGLSAVLKAQRALVQGMAAALPASMIEFRRDQEAQLREAAKAADVLTTELQRSAVRAPVLKLAEEHREDIAQQMEKWAKAIRDEGKQIQGAMALSLISCGCLALAVALAFTGQSMGGRLQPPKVDTPNMSQQSAATRDKAPERISQLR